MARQTALPPTLSPRLIDRLASAAYISVSPNTFDHMVKDGRMPKPRRISGRRIGWDIRELDRAVTNLPVEGSDENDNTWMEINAT